MTELNWQSVRIEAPHFVASVELNRLQIVVKAAPIIKYMVGWKKSKVLGYCVYKGWKYQGIER